MSVGAASLSLKYRTPVPAMVCVQIVPKVARRTVEVYVRCMYLFAAAFDRPVDGELERGVSDCD